MSTDPYWTSTDGPIAFVIFATSSGVPRLHADGTGPLTQAQVESIWQTLPTTGAAWIRHGRLFVQGHDGAEAGCLGPVEPGVIRCRSDAQFAGLLAPEPR